MCVEEASGTRHEEGTFEWSKVLGKPQHLQVVADEQTCDKRVDEQTFGVAGTVLGWLTNNCMNYNTIHVWIMYVTNIRIYNIYIYIVYNSKRQENIAEPCPFCSLSLSTYQFEGVGIDLSRHRPSLVQPVIDVALWILQGRTSRVHLEVLYNKIVLKCTQNAQNMRLNRILFTLVLYFCHEIMRLNWYSQISSNRYLIFSHISEHPTKSHSILTNMESQSPEGHQCLRILQT